MRLICKAQDLLKEFRGDNYQYGYGVIDAVGAYAERFGVSTLVVANQRHLKSFVEHVVASCKRHGISLVGEGIVPSSRPNAPFDDIYRIEGAILHSKPDCVIVVGGGSAIDASKCAIVLASLGTYSSDINAYFGTGLVSAAIEKTGKKLFPFIAVQTVASSSSHLTKYAAVTDFHELQKKIIVDNAIIPPYAVFDYSITTQQSSELTIDGVLDGISHAVEAWYGVAPEKEEMLKEIVLTGIELAVAYGRRAIESPNDKQAREALCLATDLGGYAIMIQGTSGAHLTSFSLVDVATHGRACGIMNPYFTVFYAPAIEQRVRLVGNIFQRYGYTNSNIEKMKGRQLAIDVARAMLSFNRKIGAPATLRELPHFSEAHIDRILASAKNPCLESKLKNMPVPLTADQVGEFFRPVVRAALEGNPEIVRNLPT